MGPCPACAVPQVGRSSGCTWEVTPRTAAWLRAGKGRLAEWGHKMQAPEGALQGLLPGTLAPRYTLLAGRGGGGSRVAGAPLGRQGGESRRAHGGAARMATQRRACKRACTSSIASPCMRGWMHTCMQCTAGAGRVGACLAEEIEPAIEADGWSWVLQLSPPKLRGLSSIVKLAQALLVPVLSADCAASP